jgi:hypothetical protein
VLASVQMRQGGQDGAVDTSRVIGSQRPTLGSQPQLGSMSNVERWALGYFLDAQAGERRSELVNGCCCSYRWQPETMLDQAR